MDSYIESAKALAYAEQFYAVAKDDAFSTQEGYAIHKIGKPETELPENYFPTPSAPIVISEMFEQIAKGGVPVDKMVQEMTLNNMIEAHAACCRVMALPDNSPLSKISSLGNSQYNLKFLLPQMKTAIEAFAAKIA
jgi:hypothetical protein